VTWRVPFSHYKCLSTLATTVAENGDYSFVFGDKLSPVWTGLMHTLHRVSKNSQNYFCYNFVKFTPTLTIFGTKMAKRLKLYEVHSFSTSPNLCHHTTV